MHLIKSWQNLIYSLQAIQVKCSISCRRVKAQVRQRRRSRRSTLLIPRYVVGLWHTRRSESNILRVYRRATTIGQHRRGKTHSCCSVPLWHKLCCQALCTRCSTIPFWRRQVIVPVKKCTPRHNCTSITPYFSNPIALYQLNHTRDMGICLRPNSLLSLLTVSTQMEWAILVWLYDYMTRFRFSQLKQAEDCGQAVNRVEDSRTIWLCAVLIFGAMNSYSFKAKSYLQSLFTKGLGLQSLYHRMTSLTQTAHGS